MYIVAITNIYNIMAILSVTSIGVIAKDRLDYQRWVLRQSSDTNRKHFPITSVNDIYQKYDEIVITTTASANPNYFDIYKKLNGAYAKAKKETV